MSLAFEDIGRSQKYAKRLLVQPSGTLGSEDRLINEALCQATVVSYGRTFNKSFPENPSHAQFVRSEYEKVVQQFTDNLNDGELSLHARILAKRDQVFAHSDASSRGWRFTQTTEIAFGRNPFYPMEIEEVEGLLALTHKAVDQISATRSSWKKKLFKDILGAQDDPTS